MRGADVAEPLLDAADHHIADHLAGDAGGRRDPADDLAVVAIERESDPHDLAVPAGELEAVRAPADIGTQRRHLAVMFAWASPAGMPGQQQTVLLHQPIDALGVDRGHPVGSPLALEERGDPPVSVSGSRVDEAADIR